MQKISIRQKTVEEILEDYVADIRSKIGGFSQSRDIYAIILKEGENLDQETLNKIQESLPKNLKLIVEEEPLKGRIKK